MKRDKPRLLYEVGYRSEVKALTSEDDGEEWLTITGKASTFGNVDLTGDIIQQGAFSGTIAELEKDRLIRDDGDDLAPMLLNHDAWNAHGIPIGAVVHLEQTEDALLMRGKIPKSDPRAPMIIAQMTGRYKSIRGLSIGFYIEDQDRQGEHRIIKEIKLREVSLTPFPANPGAVVLSAKSAGLATSRELGLTLTLEHALSMTTRDLEDVLRSMGHAKSSALEFASFIASKRRDSAGSGGRRDSDPMDIGSQPLDAESAALLKTLMKG